MDDHMVEVAMARKELTQDEAYFILRFAGRLGYKRAIRRMTPSLLHRVRKWFIWFGGWEVPELIQWDEGSPAWRFSLHVGDRRIWRSPTPVSLFDHRITFYGWGCDLFGRTFVRKAWRGR